MGAPQSLQITRCFLNNAFLVLCKKKPNVRLEVTTKNYTPRSLTARKGPLSSSKRPRVRHLGWSATGGLTVLCETLPLSFSREYHVSSRKCLQKPNLIFFRLNVKFTWRTLKKILLKSSYYWRRNMVWKIYRKWAFRAYFGPFFTPPSPTNPRNQRP